MWAGWVGLVADEEVVEDCCVFRVASRMVGRGDRKDSHSVSGLDFGAIGVQLSVFGGFDVTMFLSIFIRILRDWQSCNKLVALFIQSHGKHTETSVLLDDAGSAYQIAVHASGLYFRPCVTVTEYVPETKNILHQESFTSSLFSLRKDLERGLSRVHGWMRENGSKRLAQDEEMKLVQKMYSQIPAA